MLTNFRDLMVHDEYEHFLTDFKNDCFSEMQILSLKIQAYKFADFDFDEEFLSYLKNCIDTKLDKIDPFATIDSLIMKSNSEDTKNDLLDIFKLYKTLTFAIAYADFHGKIATKDGQIVKPIFSKEFVELMYGNFIDEMNTIILMPLITCIYHMH